VHGQLLPASGAAITRRRGAGMISAGGVPLRSTAVQQVPAFHQAARDPTTNVIAQRDCCGRCGMLGSSPERKPRTESGFQGLEVTIHPEGPIPPSTERPPEGAMTLALADPCMFLT